MNPDLSAELRFLEESLLQPEIRRDRARVAELLAEDFLEYGSSGRVYDKSRVLNELTAEPPHRIHLTDFHAKPLAPDLCLVTYRTVRPEGPPQPGSCILRSSIWVRRDSRWQIVFHQGTAVPA